MKKLVLLKYTWVLAVIGFYLSVTFAPLYSQGVTSNCPAATTLESLVDCILDQMPDENWELFVPPSVGVQTDWKNVVGQMLNGNCDAILLPPSLSANYTIASFVDADNSRQYCTLMEVADNDLDGIVDRGWGTFITYNTPERELSIHITHPLHDTNTGMQGITVFKETGARSFMLAGSHRHANSVVSVCQSDYEEADAAHNTTNLFQSTVQELVDYYGNEPFTAIQFHAMGNASCPGVDVYMTHGRNQTPTAGDDILDLQANLQNQHPEWVINVPGDSPGCGFHGSENVQGRLLNDVAEANVCTTFAPTYNGRFIHIEQKSAFRQAADWIVPLTDTFPASPLAITLLSTTIISRPFLSTILGISVLLLLGTLLAIRQGRDQR